LGAGQLVDGFRFLVDHVGSPSDGRILPHG
jgi:hypothetical protein